MGKRVDPVTLLTYRATIFKHTYFSSRRIAGFTLLEIMIVLAILALTVATVVPKIGKGNNKIKSTLRELTTVTRELHNKAKLSGFTYRLVLDLKEDATGKAIQTYWVERSEKNTLVKVGEEKLKPELDKDGKPKNASDFKPDPTIFKKPKELPVGLRFDSIELSRLNDPIKLGKAYIHFLPQGLVEEAAIHLKTEKDLKYTISIHPLTGKAELVTSDMKLQEIKKQ